MTPELLASATRRVQAMSLRDRERLAEEIHARQPNLLYSVLVLQRCGVTLAQNGDRAGPATLVLRGDAAAWRYMGAITDTVQERCLVRVSGRVRFIDGLAPPDQQRAVEEGIAAHPEKQMLALVLGKMNEHDLLGIHTEVEKMLVLTALNLVECIAEAAPGARDAAPLTRDGVL